MIVDSQVHIWAANTPDRPWAPGMEKRAHLPEPLGAPDLLSLMDHAGVTHAILVPPSLEGGRNDLSLAAAREHPSRFAVMGRLQISQPDARDVLRAMKGQEGMLGVRLTFHRPETRAQLTDGTADWVWPALEELALPVMVHAPDGLPHLGKVARAHPGLTLIIDHMGFARETMDDRVPEAVDRLLELAPLSDVHVKVSALPCYSSAPYPWRNLHEPLRRIIDGFGPERCFWGSDYSRLPAASAETYRQSVTMFTEELPFLTGRDRDLVMGAAIAARLGWPRLQARTQATEEGEITGRP